MSRFSSLLRRTLRIDEINERLERIEQSGGATEILQRLNRIERSEQDPPKPVEAEPSNGETLSILPGTLYSRYAVPLEYLPSRSYTARWGYSHGRIEPLAQWFAAHNDDYREFLGFLRGLDLSRIPISLSPTQPLAPAWVGGAITAFDCLALYGVVRKFSPKLYLEIGSGMTTCFARQAITDARLQTKVISIDPDPRREVDAICDQVIREALETCDVSLFDQLEAGDILFLDGSHRSFMNSDVTVFFIDVLPRIKPGVIVHVHDILLPWDYPDFFKNWYWNEQYMLAVYMMASKATLYPLLPTSWIARSPDFSDFFQHPLVHLGSDAANESWRNGGSMWFTKTQ